MTPTYALQKYIMKNQQIRPGNNSYKILPKNGQPQNTSKDTSVSISSDGNGHGIILTKFFQRNDQPKTPLKIPVCLTRKHFQQQLPKCSGPTYQL